MNHPTSDSTQKARELNCWSFTKLHLNRNTIYKKTLLENLLKLDKQLEGFSSEFATLSIATTDSQAAPEEILNNTQKWLNRKIRFSTIQGKLFHLMWVFLVLYGVLFLLAMCHR